MPKKKNIDSKMVFIYDAGMVKPVQIKKNKLEKITEIAKKINDADRFEVPSTATFSMAIDSLEGDGKIFKIKDIQKFSEDIKIVPL
jgi:hypothetical protein